MIDKPVVVIVIDTETTGTNIAGDDIVQLAAVMATIREGGTPKAATLMLSYCNPKVDIHPDAEAIHNISKETVQYAPSSAWALRTLEMLLEQLSEDYTVVLCGHNSERFDIPLMDNCSTSAGNVFAAYPHIDTYNLALRMLCDAYKKFEKPQEYKPHKLERLYEWYVGGNSANAHDAAADCHMVVHVLAKLLQDSGKTVLEAAEWSAKAEILPCIPYGKHGGTPWRSVPMGYLQYCRKNWSDTQKDVMLSLLSATSKSI